MNPITTNLPILNLTTIPPHLQTHTTTIITMMITTAHQALLRRTLLMLQEQNEDLHHSLLQTAVRMECMGTEFKSSHQLLESELQNTRVELSSLLDKFKRLRDNYSYTQQTNNLLERKLHSVAQSMDGEREHLNQRITALTDQLSSAKTTIHSMETINVTSLLQEALDKHFHPDDSVNQFLLPVAPPPVQFMDSHHYGKVTTKGEDLSLGTLPEEEESDWSEMGDEAPKCVLRSAGGHHGGTAFQPWRQERICWAGQGEGDTESESGGEEIVRQHPPHSLQIPHLHVTIHETLPAPMDDVTLTTSFKNSAYGPTEEDGYRVTASRKLGSPIRILSASLDEIPSSRRQKHRQEEQHGQLKGTEAMMDLHQPEDGTMDDSEDEIIRNWRTRSEDMGVDVREVDPGSSLDNLQSAQNMLNHFICQLQPSVEEGRGWTGGAPDEVLNGERTQL
ncbi:uncharacterized protein LOC118966633 [Oncorhynchus mykiss]|uniref:uncharacterized protein LOC118966633 n=1 Tax=Oncorhynchus mykiss TaxID=8022 RepID=UPI0018780347|nr:uncharacterized protein LOC118966633 [Oncorhynchus mykiss]